MARPAKTTAVEAANLKFPNPDRDTLKMTITRHHQRDENTTASATYSDCEKYRYELWIRWADGPMVMVIGLNPSTATEIDNDRTIERLEKWARRCGYGSLRMFNAYSFRSTDPKGLWKVADPVGPENFEFIRRWAPYCSQVVCAWGTNIKRAHEFELLKLLSSLRVYCFKQTAAGHPGHPLYLSDVTLDSFHPFNHQEGEC